MAQMATGEIIAGIDIWTPQQTHRPSREGSFRVPRGRLLQLSGPSMEVSPGLWPGIFRGISGGAPSVFRSAGKCHREYARNSSLCSHSPAYLCHFISSPTAVRSRGACCFSGIGQRHLEPQFWLAQQVRRKLGNAGFSQLLRLLGRSLGSI